MSSQITKSSGYYLDTKTSVSQGHLIGDIQKSKTNFENFSYFFIFLHLIEGVAITGNHWGFLALVCTQQIQLCEKGMFRYFQ